MAKDLMTNSQMRDVEALLHPYTNAVTHRQGGAMTIARGDGIRVIDEDGRGYIDGMAGLWCCGLGFSEPELVEVAAEQMARLPAYHVFSGRTHEPAIELAEKIKDLFPVPMARVFYCTGGSEANDSQVKLVWYMNNAMGRPEKKKIISRKRGYHGVTLVAASLTGLPLNHGSFDLPFDFVKHARCPHHWREAEQGESETEFSARLARELDELIEAEGPETVAAFIAEPVMGAGGVIIPPKGYFEAIQPVLDKHDVVFIDDEVICGFGRTGNWFGAETLNMQPRTVSMAKQLTAGYMPLSAVAMDAGMAEAIEAETGRYNSLGHGFTYGGHPVACAVGSAAIDIYKRRDIVGHVRRMAPLFEAKLKSFADHPLVGEARSLGLMGALEVSPDREARATFAQPGKVGAKLSAELQARGVVLRAIGDSLAFCPPMIIDEQGLEELFAPMEESLDAAHAWAKAEGHIG